MAIATQAQLMWRRFRKHRLAMAGAVAVILYLVVLLAEFLLRRPGPPTPSAV